MTDPDHALSGPEERLLDYIRQGKLDAEIAVRLGVPVGDVKDRTERLLKKLDVPDKAALAAWRPGETKKSPSPTASNGTGPELPADDGRRRWRWIAFASSAVVVLVGGGIAAIALTSGGSETASPPASETAEPTTTSEPAGPTPMTFSAGGVEPLTTTISSTPWGTAYWILVTSGGCFACDGPPTGLTRVSYWTDGHWSVEEVFRVPDGWTMTGIEASATGYSLAITICQSQAAEPCAHAGPEVPVLSQVWQSNDGGATWDLLAEVNRSVSVVAATGGVPLLMSRSSAQSFELVLPDGTPVQVPAGYRWLGVTFNGESIEESPPNVPATGAPIVETGPFLRRTFGNTLQDQTLEIPALDGGFAVSYFDSPDGNQYFLSIATPATPENPSATYFVQVNAGPVTVNGLWETTGAQVTAVVPSSRGTSHQAVGVMQSPGSAIPFIPVVFQFEAGQFVPLFGQWESAFAGDVLTVITGSLGQFARVSNLDGPDDCLNIRSAPSTDGGVRACVPEGTFLRLDSTQPATDDGWMPLFAPDGQQAWASLDYLSFVQVAP